MRSGSGIQEWLWILTAEEATEATCPSTIKPKGGSGLGPGQDSWGCRLAWQRDTAQGKGRGRASRAAKRGVQGPRLSTRLWGCSGPWDRNTEVNDSR